MDFGYFSEGGTRQNTPIPLPRPCWMLFARRMLPPETNREVWPKPCGTPFSTLRSGILFGTNTRFPIFLNVAHCLWSSFIHPSWTNFRSKGSRITHAEEHLPQDLRTRSKWKTGIREYQRAIRKSYLVVSTNLPRLVCIGRTHPEHGTRWALFAFIRNAYKSSKALCSRRKRFDDSPGGSRLATQFHDQMRRSIAALRILQLD